MLPFVMAQTPPRTPSVRHPHPRLRRPVAMTLDPGACIACGMCGDLVPGLPERSGPIAITPATLEAMAACPVGAIHWLEGAEPHEHRNDDA
jgi:ferredoxin